MIAFCKSCPYIRGVYCRVPDGEEGEIAKSFIAQKLKNPSSLDEGDLFTVFVLAAASIPGRNGVDGSAKTLEHIKSFFAIMKHLVSVRGYQNLQELRALWGQARTVLLRRIQIWEGAVAPSIECLIQESSDVLGPVSDADRYVAMSALGCNHLRCGTCEVGWTRFEEVKRILLSTRNRSTGEQLPNLMRHLGPFLGPLQNKDYHQNYLDDCEAVHSYISQSQISGKSGRAWGIGELFILSLSRLGNTLSRILLNELKAVPGIHALTTDFRIAGARELYWLIYYIDEIVAGIDHKFLFEGVEGVEDRGDNGYWQRFLGGGNVYMP